MQKGGLEREPHGEILWFSEKTMNALQRMMEESAAAMRNPRPPKNQILPEDQVYYEPPESYPQEAQDFLRGLAMSGKIGYALGYAEIYAQKAKDLEAQLEGFEDEKELALFCYMEHIEGMMVQEGLESGGATAVRALSRMLEGNRHKGYGPKETNTTVDNRTVNISFTEMVAKAARQNGAKASTTLPSGKASS